MAHSQAMYDKGADPQRASGRMKVSGVRAAKGLVIDASAGGMRVKGKLPRGTTPGDFINLEVAGDDESIDIRCEVRWIQRHPLRGATFGVAFDEPTDDDRRELFSIIRRAGADARCSWMAA